MFDKDFLSWCTVFVLSVCAGLLRYLTQSTEFTVKGCLLEIFTSGFVSIVTFMICKGIGLEMYLSIGLSGVVSYFGTRALSLAFATVENRVGSNRRE